MARPTGFLEMIFLHTQNNQERQHSTDTPPIFYFRVPKVVLMTSWNSRDVKSGCKLNVFNDVNVLINRSLTNEYFNELGECGRVREPVFARSNV